MKLCTRNMVYRLRFAIVVAVVVSISFGLLYSICGQECLTGDDVEYEAYVDGWEQQGDDESILEVNVLKIKAKDNADFVIYLRGKFDENGIGY